MNQQGRKYTEHLLSATMEAGFDLHAIPAVLLGGGSSVVSRHLSPKDGLCKTIFLLDDKVNAVGFERALAAVSRCQSEARNSPSTFSAPPWTTRSSGKRGPSWRRSLPANARHF